jgi:hypothetical protein
MAEQKLAPISTPIYDVKSPLEIGKWNAVGDDVPAIIGAKQQALDAQEKFAKSLEERYANPNWFNVAAGFLKPQLGGFAASLGSASQALGEGIESQRAIAPTVERMRAEIAQGRIGMETNKEQARAIDAYDQDPKKDLNKLRKIYSLAPTSDVGQSIAKRPEFEAERREQIGFGMNTAITAATAMAKDPMLQLGDYMQFQLQSNPEQAAAKQAEFAKSVDASRPPQVDAAQWNAMDRYQKMAAASDYAKAQREAGMSTEELLRKQADTAPERLGLLGSIRELALGAGIPESKDAKGATINGQQQMGMLLNKFGGNNPMEVFARAMADGKGPALLQDIDVYARQMGMSDQAKNQFQKLVKLLAENQVGLRGGSLNPTDAFGQLQTMASPNIGNSQNALVTLVDLMGHAEKHNQEKYRYAKEAKKPYGSLEYDPGYNDMRSKYAKEHIRIATSNPLMPLPEVYNPSSGNVSAKPMAPKAAPATNSPLTWDAIKAEKARRDAAKNKTQ